MEADTLTDSSEDTFGHRMERCTHKLVFSVLALPYIHARFSDHLPLTSGNNFAGVKLPG